jgi:hypothetical protein
MPASYLVTSESPSGFLDTLVQGVAQDGAAAGWCIVVPRTHLKREVTDLLQRHEGSTAWIGPRVVTLDEMLGHYARGMDPHSLLTPLQVRQVIAALVIRLHEETGGTLFAGRVIAGRVCEATLRGLSALFAELEPFGLSPADLTARLNDGAAGGKMSVRAEEISALYTRLVEQVAQSGFHGPQARAVMAAEAARHLAPPAGVRKVLLVGLDASSVANVGVRLFWALSSNATLDEVRLALVLPADPAACAWRTHGNYGVYHDWTAGGGVRRLAPEAKLLAAIPSDLREMARDPFNYRGLPVPAAGAVRVVRVPDEQVERAWVAADIKRRVLAGELRPEDIAIICRDMSDRVQDISQALEQMGVPVVASEERRAADVPAVRALIALFRLAAGSWRREDLLTVAGSPYLALGLNPTLLDWIAESAEAGIGPAEWSRRTRLFAGRVRAGEPIAGGFRPEAVDALADALDQFAAQLAALVPSGSQSPTDWVRALVRAPQVWNLQAQIEQAFVHDDAERRVSLVARDLDGVNALLHAAQDWLRGREIAGLDNAAIDAAAWYEELGVMATETRVRSSTYPRDAVFLVNPAQAGLRSWRRVYILGLSDGVFPAHSLDDERTLSEDERGALRLATSEDRAARERLYFHLATAAATESLVLVTPAADDSGKALVTSPFIAPLSLRIDGLSIEQVSASELVPAFELDILCEADLERLVVSRLREAGASEDELVGAWATSRNGSRTSATWQVERMRTGLQEALAAGLSIEDGEFAGILTAGPAKVQGPDASFTPSGLEQYGNCRLRFFLGQVVGLERQYDTAGEAASFGTLQHLILERTYRELSEAGLYPPTSEPAIDDALAVLGRVAAECTRERAASGHEELWQIDLDYVTDSLARYVRRDLSAALARESDPSAGLRSEIAALEVRIGGGDKPVAVNEGGVEFALRGKVDRIERIADPRLTGDESAANGWLVVRDYKTSRGTWSPRFEHFMSGESLQLPLYAAMVEEALGQQVFSIGESRTSLPEDPRPLAVRAVSADSSGAVVFEPAPEAHAAGGAGRNVVRVASKAALQKAAEYVSQMRRGDFAPQPGRKCFGCPLSDVCRASTLRNAATAGQRSMLPLLVTGEQLSDARVSAHGPDSEVA